MLKLSPRQTKPSGYRTFTLAAYESVGIHLAKTYKFDDRYSDMSAGDFIGVAYQDAFGRYATAEQVAHFRKQLDNFERRYGSSEDGQLLARGAVLGQIVGWPVKGVGTTGWLDLHQT